MSVRIDGREVTITGAPAEPRRLLTVVADALEAAEQGVVFVLFMALVVAVFVGVFLRYVVRVPVIWGEELALFIFVWLALLSAGIAVRRRAHFRMAAFADRLSGTPRAALEVATLALMAVLTAVVGWEGFGMTWSGLAEQAPGLGISMAWVYAAFPVSGVTMGVFLLEALVVGVAAPRATRGDK